MKNHHHQHHQHDSKNFMGLSIGDKIQVWAGAEQINGDGSFIKLEGNTLIWADEEGNIRFQFIGPEISIVKI